MLFSLIRIIIPYLFICLKSNHSKIQCPNLIFNPIEIEKLNMKVGFVKNCTLIVVNK